MSDRKFYILPDHCVHFIETPQAEGAVEKKNIPMPPESVYRKIEREAEKNFPDNFQAQYRSIMTEIDAYNKFVNFDFEGISEADKLRVLKESRKSNSWEGKATTIGNCLHYLRKIEELSQYIGQNKVRQIWRKIRKEYKNKTFTLQLIRVLDACRDAKIESEVEPVKNILIDMENIIGNSCYNGNIQNYGSGGVWEGEGRHFRYPVTFEKSDKKWKVTPEISAKKLMSGHYAFGANQLSIYSALYKIIKYLEKEHGVILKDKK